MSKLKKSEKNPFRALFFFLKEAQNAFLRGGSGGVFRGPQILEIFDQKFIKIITARGHRDVRGCDMPKSKILRVWMLVQKILGPMRRIKVIGIIFLYRRYLHSTRRQNFLTTRRYSRALSKHAYVRSHNFYCVPAI